MTQHEWLAALWHASALAEKEWCESNGDLPAFINSPSAVAVKRALAELTAANRKRHRAPKERTK